MLSARMKSSLSNSRLGFFTHRSLSLELSYIPHLRDAVVRLRLAGGLERLEHVVVLGELGLEGAQLLVQTVELRIQHSRSARSHVRVTGHVARCRGSLGSGDRRS